MSAAGTLQPNSLSKGLWPRTLDELLAFIGIADKPEIDFPIKVNGMLSQIGRIADDLILAAIEKRTSDEFSATALQVFNDYVRVLRAKSDLLQVVLRDDRKATERVVSQSLAEAEGEFRNNGPRQFGESASEQALFAIWTLRKTASQIWKLFDPDLVSVPLSESAATKAEQLSSEFALYSAWAQFHLECLTTAMRLDRAVCPDVLPAIIDGLRSEVNAFAIAKQLVNLYIPAAEDLPVAPYPWDEEDEELLSSSMRDMELEAIED